VWSLLDYPAGVFMVDVGRRGIRQEMKWMGGIGSFVGSP